MRITRTSFFYFIALCAVSYFLWQYLYVPKELLISLIISLVLIAFLVSKKSTYTASVGVILISFHLLWLIGFLIPVYEKQPDIRQRYRRNPSLLFSTSDSTTGETILLQHGDQYYKGNSNTLVVGKPLYQGDSISVEGNSSMSDAGAMVSFRDGSTVQLFPPSSLRITTLSPDFIKLSGSRIGITLSGGIIAVHTRRRSFDMEQRYVRAGENSFSCIICIIAFSGNKGSMVSMDSFTRQPTGGEPHTYSGGTYIFSLNTLSHTDTGTLFSLLTHFNTIASNQEHYYNTRMLQFITSQRGWSMDTSILLSDLSKVKMALVGLIDWTYWDKFNHLSLYEYLLGKSTLLPDFVSSEKNIYEFIY